MAGQSRWTKAAGCAGTVLGAGLVATHFLLSAATLAVAGYSAAALVGLITLWGICLAVSRRGLRLGLGLLGFSLFLFGTQAYVYPGVVFGLVADAAALAFCWRNVGRVDDRSLGLTGVFMAALAVMCLASTLLLPWGRLGTELVLFGPTGFFGAMFFSPADAPAYALASAWRLAVLVVLARELARLDCPDRFGLLATGVTGGLLAALVFGLYEHFQGDHYLLHYRFTSLFANPGWFAEYAAVAAPYLLLPLARRRWRSRGLVAAGLALCGVGLVLSLARAGWIVGSLTFAAAAWLYFRPGPLARFHRPFGYLPALTVAGVVVVGLAFWGAGKELSAVSRPINALLVQRVDKFTDSPRPTLFRSGLCIAAERPGFGLGFESYARQYPLLLATPGSWLNRFGDPKAEVFETAHNMYVQLLSGLGLAGLALWLAMVGRAGWVLWRRARDFASLPDAVLLLSLMAFHGYAVFQEMFYVPPVLFLLFIPLSRAMALEVRAGMALVGRRGWLAMGAWGLAFAAMTTYALDIGLGGTAAQLGLFTWRAPGRQAVFEGFYPPETAGETTFRWSVGDAAILLPPGTPAVTLRLSASGPNAVAVYTTRAFLGMVRLAHGTPVHWRVRLPEAGTDQGQTLFLVPARTVVPQAASGVLDPRRLGIGVGLSY